MSTRRARVKVTEKHVTRAQAAAEFGRKKAKQRRQQWHRRVLIVAGGLFLTYAVIGSWWMVHTGKVEKMTDVANARFWQWTANVGFRLDQVTLTGRAHADPKAVKAALGIEQGAPILSVSLAEMKERLETIPEVKTASISRALPNTLTIQITERTPAAFWQQDGNLQLIDSEGVVLPRAKYREKMVLPVVVGNDAPKHMDELIALLDAVPSLKPDIAAAVRVGGRRWNIQLTREIVVMLPEEEPVKAWKRFATLVTKEALLSKAIRSVDMRIEDRVFIMPVEEKKNPITLTGARET